MFCTRFPIWMVEPHVQSQGLDLNFIGADVRAWSTAPPQHVPVNTCHLSSSFHDVFPHIPWVFTGLWFWMISGFTCSCHLMPIP